MPADFIGRNGATPHLRFKMSRGLISAVAGSWPADLSFGRLLRGGDWSVEVQRDTVLVISESEVRQVLSMKDCIDAIEACLVEQSNGTAISPMRTTVDLGTGRSRYNPKQPGFMRLLPGSLPKTGYLGAKIYVDVSPDYTDRTVFFLYGAGRGEFLALISADLLSDIRTGAVGGVAAKYLSRKDSSVVGVFGSGRQARTQLEAISNVRRISRVKVISRSREHADKYAAEMREKVRADFEVCRSPDDVIEGSDVVVTATTSAEPLFPGKLVSEGTHVNAIGASFPSAREVDTDLVKRAKVVVILKEQALRENGEFLIPMARKEFGADRIHAELCDVVSGKVEGRTNDREVTLFKFNGLAIWDIAAGALVYQKAMDAGLGKKFEL